MPPALLRFVVKMKMRLHLRPETEPVLWVGGFPNVRLRIPLVGEILRVSILSWPNGPITNSKLPLVPYPSRYYLFLRRP